MTIFRDKEKKEPKVEFSYPQSEALAEMIVKAWTDEKFRAQLLDRKNAKEILAERGFFLQNPVVITDEDYYNDYVMQNKNEVVFVLPQRPGDSKGKSLLDTAKLLMAITPNGI
jgi:hypothetical protein